ncbi:hypothetical protein PVK06_040788 [Gossypium arboreum]|uniref:Uncharacterized protein n=1 Tax=Gossypium arboreum TaxID=29729 RepID=A0ABR0N6D4_GOSAR|nr:hypothetical protein PVK06_040788 [Gossypium arboreum]
MKLGLDVNIHKLEVEKLRKGKNKAEEDSDSLKIDYKKLRMLIRTSSLARKDALKKSLLESQSERERLRARVVELEKSLHQHRSRNSVIKLKASLSKIEELKEKVEELETALRDSKIRVELLKANNDRCREQLHRSQD